MTMMFRTLTASANALLESVRDDNTSEYFEKFRVFNHQAQARSAADFLDNNRTVRVFYTSGVFPKSGGSMNGPMDHDITYKVDMIAASKASLDLTAFTDDNATDSERVTAMLGSKSASLLANDSFDELTDIIFQILMDARNQDLGLAQYSVGSRWIQSIKKDEPIPVGNYVILTGSMQLTASVEETVTGEQPKEAVSMTTNLNDISGDTEQKTEVQSDAT